MHLPISFLRKYGRVCVTKLKGICDLLPVLFNRSECGIGV